MSRFDQGTGSADFIAPCTRRGMCVQHSHKSIVPELPVSVDIGIRGEVLCKAIFKVPREIAEYRFCAAYVLVEHARTSSSVQ